MTQNIKYPRTYHFEWSLGLQNDDRLQLDLSQFEGKDIVITEKMDGENTTMTSEKIYARSVDSAYHESQSYVRSIWGRIKHLIPNNVRICGENVAALHSIQYSDLEDYFLCFSIWDGSTCLDWDTTKELCAELGLAMVPVLWEGMFDIDFLKTFDEKLDLDKQEGYVVRLKDSFKLEDFQKSVVKFVRPNHVQSDKHWKFQKIVYNTLIDLR